MKDLIKQLLRENLIEAKNIGNLYHFTSYKNLMLIIEDQYVLKSTIQPYVSFTRNKNFKSSSIPMQVRLTVDGNTLSNKYRIQSYADVRAGYGRGTEDESEERISLNKYPRGVDISKSLIEIQVIPPQDLGPHDDEMGEPPSLMNYYVLLKYIQENGVPVKIVKKFS